MKYRLERTQQLNCSIDVAWDFFSSPHNLEKITPREMGFVVLTNLESDEIYEGLVIEYTVRPLLNIPLKWKTRITQVDFQKSFTDFQEKGPYKLWNHSHYFEARENGVFMRDVVDYELPFGILGNLTHTLVVKRKLNHIFDFRYRILEELFNKQ